MVVVEVLLLFVEEGTVVREEVTIPPSCVGVEGRLSSVG